MLQLPASLCVVLDIEAQPVSIVLHNIAVLLFQQLNHRMQDIGMSLVEEGGVNIGHNSTDVQSGKLTLEVGAAQQWGPEADDRLWDEGKRAFSKVSKGAKLHSNWENVMMKQLRH